MSFVLGIILCSLAIFMVAIRGGNPAMLFDYNALLLVVCGTFASMLITMPFAAIKDHIRAIKGALRTGTKPKKLTGEILELARVARREGVLALEGREKTVHNHLLRQGLILMFSAADHQIVRSILENEAQCTTRRECSAAEYFERIAIFAPGIGMVGTLIEIVQMLFKYNGPNTLAPQIASSLLPVVYGTLLAYLVLLPLSARIRAGSERHALLRGLCIEGVLAIQAGEPLHIVEERLKVFLNDEVRYGFRHTKT